MKLFYSLLLTTLLWCSFGFSQCADNISLTTQEQIDAFPATYSGCTAFSGQLSISGGAGNLNGLSQITTVGSLVINNVPNLANYAGLNHLTTITGDLSIYGQTPPIINSFSALTSIGGTLSVGNCSDLTQLPSFGALASLGGVNLTNNSILANIASLSTVTNLNAGTIYLYDNTSLTSLSGLENINPTSISNITVIYNYQLATCNQASICSYIALGGTTNFFSNAVGCNNYTDVISACNPSCPAGDVYLSSQAEVDAFIIAHPSCTALNGSLTIAGADITNLNGLSNITSVLGDFAIANNSQLTSLTGLNALTTVKGNLNISQNAALASLNGLNSWSSIPTNSINISNNAVLTTLSGLSGATALSDIAINGNNSLISISGLANLVTVSSIGIANNPALISLTGLNGITTTSNIYITSNDSLTNLNGLNGLSNAGSISISNNASLQSLNGLNSLTSVTNSFDISSNSLLTNLAGLNSLTIVGSAYNSYYNRLTISNNPLLNNLSGLNSITTLYFLDLNNNATLANVAALSNLTFLQYLNVVSNPLLTSLTGLNNVNPTSMAYITLKSSTALATCNVNSICTFLSNGGAHDISGNATGCNTNLEVQIACGAITQCPAGTLVFNSQAQLNTFAATYPTCTAVAGSVFISGADITNLNAFSHISSIGGGLTIQDNPLLTSLTGLNALLNVGDITGSAVIISGNPVLTNLSAFSSLANVKDLIITNNAALTSISGLSNLVAAYSIGITNNALLTSLNGLNGLTSTNSISITNNPLLVDLSGLNGITTIFYSINISSNVLLTSLNGLNNLTAITYYYSSIFITDNPVLTSLSALNNLNPANIYSISLYYNPLLSVCNVPIICTFLANGGFANIYNNATGCNTTDEVQIVCGNSATPTFTAVSPTSLTVCEAEATEITLTGLVPNSTSKVNYTINTDNYTVYLNSNVAGTAVFNINLNNAQNGQTLTITSVERIDVHTGILTVSTNNTVSLNIGTSVTYYADNDGDGYGGDYIYLSAGLVYSCSGPPVGYVTNNLDCYDSDPTVHPGSVEISCNGIDDDCNGLIDANDPGMVSPQRWFADADEDGYGNALVASTACTKPLGYVGNNTDCDDTNSLIHPNQTWYTDNDGDHYGIGAFVTQCARPLHGYLATELTATTGDCNDNDASTSPGTQRLVFSGAPKFTTAVCSPLLGTLHTNFSFEVTYFDTNNNLPAVTFPRVYLDYEGNNIFNDENDRVVIMTASDVNDLNTVDGKKYIGTINSLPNGTNWQTSIQILNGSCVTATGPFNYPDVVVEPNLEIFANDIIFSTIHPTVSAPLTVNAVIHNVSDYPARNFYAHLVNQYDPSIVYADILVANVAPQSSTTVSWNITTPNVPAWCPMQVILDYTNVITETNELNNSAVRPFINGNYNLIGGIAVTGEASPSVSYIFPNDYIGVSGHGEYFGTPVPLLDPSVAGATLTFKIIETGATYSTYTDSQGNYSYLFPAPSIPGVYHIQGELTDYTFIGNFSTSFTRLMGCGTDLASGVSLTTNTVLDKNLVGNNTIIEGESVSGEFSVGNSCTPIGINTLLSINQSGGTPAIQDVTVPPLASNGSFHTSFNNIVFNTPGSYSICSTADGSNLVNEDIEYNNSYCQYINVLPNKPDIRPYLFSPISQLTNTNFTYQCENNVTFTLVNLGGVASGPFTCDIIVRHDGIISETLHQTVTNI